MEGWFGGRTSFVVPITGQDILAVVRGGMFCVRQVKETLVEVVMLR
jgi:hypothetical protein